VFQRRTFAALHTRLVHVKLPFLVGIMISMRAPANGFLMEDVMEMKTILNPWKAVNLAAVGNVSPYILL